MADITLIDGLAFMSTTAGDTEVIRLNLKDSSGESIDMTSDYTGTLAFKRDTLDESSIITPIPAVFYTPGEGYTVDFTISGTATTKLLNYDDKNRRKVTVLFDIEIHNELTAVRTTIMAGKFYIERGVK